VDGVDGGEELFERHALEKVSACAGLEGAVDILVAVEGGKDNKPGLGKIFSDGLNRLNSTQLWHLEVHQGHVGPKSAEFFDSFQAVTDSGYYLKVVAGREESDQTLANHLMVFYQHDANWIFHDSVLAAG
jgi:hypothetical protein